MNNFISLFEQFCSSQHVLLGVMLGSIFFKFYIIYFLNFKVVFKIKAYQLLVTILKCILITSIIVDIAWIAVTLRILLLPNVTFPILLSTYAQNHPYTALLLTVISNLSWLAYVFQYHFIFFFINIYLGEKYLTNKNIYILCIGIIFICAFLVVFTLNIWSWGHFSDTTAKVRNIFTIYATLFLSPFALFIITSKLKARTLPRLVHAQIFNILIYIIFPIWLGDLLQYYPFNIHARFFTESYASVVISTVMLCNGIFICARRLVGLGFLNLRSYLPRRVKFDFIQDFKKIIDSLSYVIHFDDIRKINTDFFKTALDIDSNNINFIIRFINTEPLVEDDSKFSEAEPIVAKFFENPPFDLQPYITTNEIFVLDDLELENFYQPTASNQALVNFLRQLRADAFVPIYKNNTLIAYIVLDRYARSNKFYTSTECDEIAVFAQYLSPVIYLLQQKSIQLLIEREQDLRHKLVVKSQELDQYRQSVKAFWDDAHNPHIGIIFYKNKKFFYANQIAYDALGIDLNLFEGDLFVQHLKKVVAKVEQYKNPLQGFTPDGYKPKLMYWVTLSVAGDYVIIMIYPPHAADIVHQYLAQVREQDTDKWNYFLYQETTDAGHKLAKLLPGTFLSEVTVKAEIMRLVISIQPIIFGIEDKIAEKWARIIHQLSGKKDFITLDASLYSQEQELMVKLFGNAYSHLESISPLLSAKDALTTLFIPSIHALPRVVQKALWNYAKHGYYTPVGSTKRIYSSIRVMAAVDPTYPRLHTPDKQGIELRDYCTFSVINAEFINQSIRINKPELHEFKNEQEYTDLMAIYKHLRSVFNASEKMEKKLENPVYKDPDIIRAQQLGKNALKDERMMKILWKKFEKNQNKIAQLLGVNRSTVNRKCKYYGLD